MIESLSLTGTIFMLKFMGFSHHAERDTSYALEALSATERRPLEQGRGGEACTSGDPLTWDQRPGLPASIPGCWSVNQLSL